MAGYLPKKDLTIQFFKSELKLGVNCSVKYNEFISGKFTKTYIKEHTPFQSLSIMNPQAFLGGLQYLIGVSPEDFRLSICLYPIPTSIYRQLLFLSFSNSGRRNRI